MLIFIKTSLSTLVFVLTLLLGIGVVISRRGWFTAWLGLELNFISFLPLLVFFSERGGERVIKYFIIQAFARQLIIISR